MQTPFHVHICSIYFEIPGNLLALQVCGSPMRRPTKAELRLRLWLAARTVESNTTCPFRVSRLVAKGLQQIQIRGKRV